MTTVNLKEKKMNKNKLKTYVLIVSRNFPMTHPRKGEPTYFPEKILKGLNLNTDESIDPKGHTIRGNYDLWKKRINEVAAGKAILSIRYWTGKPYNSKQETIIELTKDYGVGVQELVFGKTINDIIIRGDDRYITPNIETIAKNDGLTVDDFKAWFQKSISIFPMAVIHFSNFRY